jgi:hypothetical protein
MAAIQQEATTLLIDISLAKENLFTILLLPGKTRDSYLDTKKRRPSKTVKTKFLSKSEPSGTTLDDTVRVKIIR